MASEEFALRANDQNLIDETLKLQIQEVYFNVSDSEKETAKMTVSEEQQKRVPAAAPYPFWCSVRFLVITLIGFLGSMNLYALRVNLSIALPCLVFINDTSIEKASVSSPNHTSPTTSPVSGCSRPAPMNTSDPSSLPLEWTGEMRGLVNGMFYVGYVIFQIPSALLANRYGAKRVMFLFMSLCTLANLTQHPFAYLLGRQAAHWAFIVLRFLNGVGSAAFLPVYTAMLSNWAPPLERSRMMGTVFVGGNLGIVLTFATGGFLCKSLGWPALFYIPGGLSILWLACWAMFVSDAPETHPLISTAERDYILASQGRGVRQRSFGGDAKCDGSSHKSIGDRWRSTWRLLRHVLTSPCVLALCAAHVACDYGDYTFLTNIPSFMDEVLYFNIETNGVLSAVPYVMNWVVISGVGFAVDHLLDRRRVPLLLVRKTVTAIGLGVPAVIVCLLSLTDCSRPFWALVILFTAVSLMGFCVSGFYVNYMEVAGRHSGATFAFGNSIGSVTGFVAPFLVGWITSNHTHAEWSVAFFVCAGVMAVGALVYLVFASAELQLWAHEDCAHLEIGVSAQSSAAVIADGNDEAHVRFTPVMA